MAGDALQAGKPIIMEECGTQTFYGNRDNVRSPVLSALVRGACLMSVTICVLGLGYPVPSAQVIWTILVWRSRTMSGGKLLALRTWSGVYAGPGSQLVRNVSPAALDCELFVVLHRFLSETLLTPAYDMQYVQQYFDAANRNGYAGTFV